MVTGQELEDRSENLPPVKLTEVCMVKEEKVTKACGLKPPERKERQPEKCVRESWARQRQTGTQCGRLIIQDVKHLSFRYSVNNLFNRVLEKLTL